MSLSSELSRSHESSVTPRISLCMIVKDEAVDLPDCLRSAVDLVDEMIVVDTGSTDATIAIAESFGAQIRPFTWCDDFAVARNAALSYAQGDWILVLDADERLLPEIVPDLRAAVRSADTLVVNLLRQEVGARQAPYSLISRLFRRRADIVFTRPYHELIDDSVLAIMQREPGWRVVDLATVAIAHTGYQPAVMAQRQKGDRARRIMSGYLRQHPDDAYICNKLGALYLDTGEVVPAKKLLERGLRSPTEPPVRYELHYHLGCLYAEQQNFVQAATQFQAAVEQPILPALKLGAYLYWGNLCLEQHQAIAAQELYTTALQIAPTLAQGHYNLGMALRALGDLAGAIAHYHQAIALAPDDAAAHQNLGVALLKAGQVADSLTAFERAIALHQQAGSPEAERLRHGLRNMGFY